MVIPPASVDEDHPLMKRCIDGVTDPTPYTAAICDAISAAVDLLVDLEVNLSTASSLVGDIVNIIVAIILVSYSLFLLRVIMITICDRPSLLVCLPIARSSQLHSHSSLMLRFCC